jgi:hypothetical protein
MDYLLKEKTKKILPVRAAYKIKDNNSFQIKDTRFKLAVVLCLLYLFF